MVWELLDWHYYADQSLRVGLASWSCGFAIRDYTGAKTLQGNILVCRAFYSWHIVKVYSVIKVYVGWKLA